MSTAEQPTIPGERACVVVLDGFASVESVPLGERALVVGRDPECAIRVFARGVSRRHCAIWCEAGVIWLMDLASRHGTFVDGHPLIFGAVSPGAVIQLGDPPQASLTIRCRGA